MSDFSFTRHPKARVPHQCVECQSAIRKGEQYARTSGVWEGSPFSFATCDTCHEVRKVWHAFAREVSFDVDDESAAGDMWADIALWIEAFEYECRVRARETAQAVMA